MLGTSDQVLRTIERGFPEVEIFVDDGHLRIFGPTNLTSLVVSLLEELVELAREGERIDPETVRQIIGLVTKVPSPSGPREVRTGRGRMIRAKTPGQEAYLRDLDTYPVVFGIGPAGTGKTYLAMAQAVSALLSGEVKKLVLTRPAVEAGENLGFLPGSATEKIDPYLRPLFDALDELLEEGTLPQLIATGAIEIAPLAYMRGRTLNDAYIILDEAQNTTPAQMKMFLTRLGFNSHMVVTGDDTQIDLGKSSTSGLVLVQQILQGVPQIAFSHLSSADVVRNPLVAEIIDAYSRWEGQEAARNSDWKGNHERRGF